MYLREGVRCSGGDTLCASVCVPVCSCVCVCIYIHVCVHSLAFVCTFHVLTGWLAAVLESLLTESVGSVGYFYTLACVREQVEALRTPTRSRSDDRQYAIIYACYNQGQVSKQSCKLKIMLNIFTNVQICKFLRIDRPIVA